VTAQALVLDTHAWLWLVLGDRRLSSALAALERASSMGKLFVPAIAVYEAAMIGVETDEGRRRGRRAVVMRPTVREWIRDALSKASANPLALEADAAVHAAALAPLHDDPFDRLIVATAVAAGGRLVTADSKILGFASVARVPVLKLE